MIESIRVHLERLISIYFRPKAIQKRGMMMSQRLAHMGANTHPCCNKRAHHTKQRHHAHQTVRTIIPLWPLPIAAPWPDDISDFIHLPYSTQQPDGAEHKDHRLHDVERVCRRVEVPARGVWGEEAGCGVVVVVIVLVVDGLRIVSATDLVPVACLLDAVRGVDGAGSACDVELAVPGDVSGR